MLQDNGFLHETTQSSQYRKRLYNSEVSVVSSPPGGGRARASLYVPHDRTVVPLTFPLSIFAVREPNCICRD